MATVIKPVSSAQHFHNIKDGLIEPLLVQSNNTKIHSYRVTAMKHLKEA
tara:strand:+ start:442 stop:588 length:147 start_codon:yes stop_codon:yes gene_type:complete